MSVRRLTHALVATALLAAVSAPAQAANTFTGRYHIAVTGSGSLLQRASGTDGRDACPNPFTESSSAKYKWSTSYTARFEGTPGYLSTFSLGAHAKPADQSFSGGGSGMSAITGGEGCINEALQCTWTYRKNKDSDALLIAEVVKDKKTKKEQVELTFHSPEVSTASSFDSTSRVQPAGCTTGDVDDVIGPSSDVNLDLPLRSFNETHGSIEYDWQIGDGNGSKARLALSDRTTTYDSAAGANPVVHKEGHLGGTVTITRG